MTPFLRELEKLAGVGGAFTRLGLKAALRSTMQSAGRAGKSAATSTGRFFRRQFHHGVVGGKTLGSGEESLMEGVKRLRSPVGSVKEAWESGSALGKAGLVLGSAIDANNIKSTKGQDRAGAIGSGAANLLAAGALHKGLFIPGMAGYIAAGIAGDKAGRLAGKALGAKKAPPQYDVRG